MPLPRPSPGQSKEEFLASCMANGTMNDEYPDESQRYAVCNARWDAKDSVNMKTAVFKIYGDIGESSCSGIFCDTEEMISSKEISEFIDNNQDAEQFIIRINSRGGDVQEGWAIHDLLVSSGKKIKTIGEGKIYSIATIIFLAGSEREIMKNADGLIHNPFIPPYTLADKYESGDLEKLAVGLQQEEAKILDFYVSRTGSAKEKIAEYMSAETKLSAEDMLSLGFATKIIEPVVALAYLKPIKSFKMDEKAFFEKLGSTLDGAISKIKNFSRIEPENLVLTDVDGNELTLEKAEGSPAVGDAATPDGTFTMESGQVIVVADGVITEIREPQATELEKAKQRIAELESQLTEAKTEKEKAVAAEAKFREAETEAKALVSELSKLKNEWTPPQRQKFNKVDKAGNVNLATVAEIRRKLNNPKSE